MKKDITNQKFGRLTAKKLFGRYWEKETYGDVSANAVGRKTFLPLIYLMGILGAAVV